MSTRAANPKCYSVITADVVGSRGVEKLPVGSFPMKEFPLKRDQKLNELTALHRKQKLTLSPYTVTAWDEFQVVLRAPINTPRVILDLRRLFYPFELWIAVGIGAAFGVREQPINVHAGGEAFERARLAADRLKSESTKYRVLTSFESGNETFDTIANTIYHLQDSLIEGTTERQWAAINMQLETGLQEETARRLDLDNSTVSRTLKRGYYWHLLETVKTMELVVQKLL